MKTNENNLSFLSFCHLLCYTSLSLYVYLSMLHPLFLTGILLTSYTVKPGVLIFKTGLTFVLSWTNSGKFFS